MNQEELTLENIMNISAEGHEGCFVECTDDVQTVSVCLVSL